MAIEKAKEYFRQYDMEGKIQEFEKEEDRFS